MSSPVPQEVIDRLRRAVATAQENQRSEATRMLQEVTREAPHLVDAWSWLAYSTDDPLERVGSMQRVVSLDPENKDARGWLVRNGFPVQDTPRSQQAVDEVDGMWVGEFEREQRENEGALEGPPPELDAGAEIDAALGALDALEGREEESGTEEAEFEPANLEEVDFTPLPRSPSSPDFAELMRDLRPASTAGDSADSADSADSGESEPVPAALDVDAKAGEPFPAADSRGIGLDALGQATGAPSASPLEMLDAIDTLPPGSRKPRVLLLYSDGATRGLLRTAFTQLGCDVSLARDQGEVLQLATKQVPDLIFVSGQFEGGDAFDLSRTLKALPETAGVVFVAHQPDAGMLQKLRARTSGVDDYLTGELSASAVNALYEKRLGEASSD